VSIDDVPDPNADPEHRSQTITQALGGAATFLEVAPHVGTEPLVLGWRYLLCSDGLTDMVNIASIEDSIVEDDGVTVVKLVDKAMSAGGKDNISIVLVRIQEAGGDPNNMVGGQGGGTDVAGGATG
jgi:serine/threonine protein phosphatase PrpC